MAANEVSRLVLQLAARQAARQHGNTASERARTLDGSVLASPKMSRESLAFLFGFVAAIRFTYVGTFMREEASVCDNATGTSHTLRDGAVTAALRRAPSQTKRTLCQRHSASQACARHSRSSWSCPCRWSSWSCSY